jgi:hypothetical protein
MTRSHARQGTGMRIPYTDLSRARNSWFGETYGTVRVSCRDEEGNRFSFDSTSMTPAKKTKVFFSRDVNVDGVAPTAAKPPCWFVFWASNMGGPCSWMYTRTSRHAGGRITWAFDPGRRGAEIRPLNSARTQFRIELGGSGVFTQTYSFESRGYPASGTFTNSAGRVANIASGRISYSFIRQPWEAIDVAEKVVRHELRHVEQYRNWVTSPSRGGWRGMSNTDYLTGPVAGYPDLLPDVYEDGFGTAWNNAVTYPTFPISYGYDSELDCELAAGMPNIASASDWAFPGKQWH